MNKHFLIDAAKSNWYLVLALVAMPVIGVVVALMPEKTDDIQAATVPVNMTDEEAAAVRAAQNNVPWINAVRDPDAEAHAAIEEYKAQIADRNKENAGALARMANLYYSKFADWENAALYYEMLLREYPDYESNKVTYANLASCYERLKEYDLAITVYERMRDRFGPGTKEYEFATYKLDNPSWGFNE